MASWTVLSDRNPELNQAEITAHLKEATAQTQWIYIEGYDPLDITLGHVTAWHASFQKIPSLSAKMAQSLMDNVALQIAEQRPDLRIERLKSESAGILTQLAGGRWFRSVGDSLSEEDNVVAEALLNQYFPDRTVHFVNVNALWMNGGGVHCVTNDQPE